MPLRNALYNGTLLTPMNKFRDGFIHNLVAGGYDLDERLHINTLEQDLEAE